MNIIGASATLVHGGQYRDPTRVATMFEKPSYESNLGDVMHSPLKLNVFMNIHTKGPCILRETYLMLEVGVRLIFV